MSIERHGHDGLTEDEKRLVEAYRECFPSSKSDLLRLADLYAKYDGKSRARLMLVRGGVTSRNPTA